MMLGGEGALGVAIGTCFDIGECPGIVGAKGGSRAKVVVRDLSEIAICGLRGQVLRSEGMS
jgi:hypothetical protein